MNSIKVKCFDVLNKDNKVVGYFYAIYNKDQNIMNKSIEHNFKRWLNSANLKAEDYSYKGE